jgi:hypothetical protein
MVNNPREKDARFAKIASLYPAGFFIADTDRKFARVEGNSRPFAVMPVATE